MALRYQIYGRILAFLHATFVIAVLIGKMRIHGYRKQRSSTMIVTALGYETTADARNYLGIVTR